jgi:hypothetical protein
MSEIFGATGLLGTTLTHLQTFRTTATALPGTTQPSAVITNNLQFLFDAQNSSSSNAEVRYDNGIFTYTASDNVSRAMINLTINVVSSAPFNMTYLVFPSSGTTAKITGPTIPASGSGTTYGLTMKVSFIMSTGDKFILQAWGNTVAFTNGSVIVVEKLPVAQGGGGQRWISVKPIPKRHPSRKSSLRISRVSTKKGDRK